MRKTMKRILIAAALFAATPAIAQQQERPPTYDEVMAAKAQVEGQRDFAQGQAQQAAASAQSLGRDLKAARDRIAELEKLCADACKPKKDEPTK
jgi:hypothetical protein